MSEKTNISYVDSTFSFVLGCAKVSPGCANCFAERWAEKFSAGPAGRKDPVIWGRTSAGGTRRLASAAKWREVKRWNTSNLWCSVCGEFRIGRGYSEHGFCDCGACLEEKTRRILVDLCDPFDPDIKPAWLALFLGFIKDTPNLIWYLLTKRPELWQERLESAIDALTDENGQALECAKPIGPTLDMMVNWHGGLPPSNVRMGVSVEDQKRADERIPALLAIPAAFRWVSFEPLLGQIDIHGVAGIRTNGLRDIKFAVIGGESMKPRSKARPCNVDWIRNLVGQCEQAGVPVHVKQLGSNAEADVSVTCDHPSLAGMVGVESRKLNLNHWQGGDPAEWPEYLRKYHEVTI